MTPNRFRPNRNDTADKEEVMLNVVADSCTTCRRGAMVQVRSLQEIAATLDADGKRDGLPFMPEMAEYCGGTFRIHRIVARTCVEGAGGMRTIPDAVFLEDVRCTGKHHGGCQRRCLIFWKTAWLKPAGGDIEFDDVGKLSESPIPDLPVMNNGTYVCQSTCLAEATAPDRRNPLGQLIQDLVKREISVPRLFRILITSVRNKARAWMGRGTVGQLAGTKKTTPVVELNLQAGELVQVRSRSEIEATLDENGRNQGLSFDPEMLDCCGRVYRVAGRIERMIHETTHKMIDLKNTVSLEGACCEGVHSRNCPRANYLMFREAWLKRVI
jgi:hypothetical protein